MESRPAIFPPTPAWTSAVADTADRQIRRQADRQTDKTGRQTDKTGRQTGRQRQDRQADRQR